MLSVEVVFNCWYHGVLPVSRIDSAGVWLCNEAESHDRDLREEL